MLLIFFVDCKIVIMTTVFGITVSPAILVCVCVGIPYVVVLQCKEIFDWFVETSKEESRNQIPKKLNQKKRNQALARAWRTTASAQIGAVTEMSVISEILDSSALTSFSSKVFSALIYSCLVACSRWHMLMSCPARQDRRGDGPDGAFGQVVQVVQVQRRLQHLLGLQVHRHQHLPIHFVSGVPGSDHRGRPEHCR